MSLCDQKAGGTFELEPLAMKSWLRNNLRRRDLCNYRSFLFATLEEKTMGDYEACMWRVGTKLGRTIYAVLDAPGPDNCDVILGMMDTRELAEHIVRIHNATLTSKED